MSSESRSQPPAEARRSAELAANRRVAILLFGCLPAGLLLWWPTDALLFGDSAEARSVLSRARIELSLISLGGLAALFFLPICARYPKTISAVIASGLAVRFGQLAGLLGGPGAPWWHAFHLVPLCTAAVRARLWPRALATFGVAGLSAGAFLMTAPRYRSDPASAYLLSTLVFACLVSIVTGHLAERLWGQAFDLRLALTDEARRLEERVREQTAELKALTAGLQAARESERKHIARELHDDLGQQLTGIEYALTLVDQRFEKDAASVAKNLKDLRRQLDRTQETLRRILLDLRPPVLDELGFPAAADWLIGQIGERAGLRTQLDIDQHFPTLPEEYSVALYRVLQEALSNVVRHAQASSVRINLHAAAGEIALTVTDDGAGIQPQPKGSRGGLGLIGMRERTEALGGSVAVMPAPEGGVSLTVRIPFTPIAARVAS